MLPIFLSIIVVSSEVLESVTISYSLTNNYAGKMSAKYLCEVGLKHGIKYSRENGDSKEYYINLVDNKIATSDKSYGNEYTKVKVIRKNNIEEIIVTIESVSFVDRYSKKLSHEYTIYIEKPENNIDNHLENLDTNGNSSIT